MLESEMIGAIKIKDGLFIGDELASTVSYMLLRPIHLPEDVFKIGRFLALDSYNTHIFDIIWSAGNG